MMFFLRITLRCSVGLAGLLCFLHQIPGAPTHGQDAPDDLRAPDSLLLENFEEDPAGGLPAGWVYLNERKLKPLTSVFMHPEKRFYVVQEGDNKFVRVQTENASQHIMLRVDGTAAFDWRLERFPRLSWDWRALRLPEGASEEKENDTGAAIYVTFDRTDWLGRPHSIKYSYSSSLPAGTVVSTGNVKVIVVASARNGIGRWMHTERDVAADYRKLFDKDPPRPVLITLWSDSDNTHSVSEADFDNIRLLPED